MSPTLIIATVICVIGISVGQMLFKKAASALSSTPGWQAWVLNGWLISALALYGVTTIAWVYILKYAPLHLAYPFMGLAFLFVPCLGWLFLDEPIRWPTLVGGVLILAGIAVAARGS